MVVAAYGRSSLHSRPLRPQSAMVSDGHTFAGSGEHAPTRSNALGGAVTGPRAPFGLLPSAISPLPETGRPFTLHFVRIFICS